MRVDVSFKYLERSEFIDNILEKNIKKMERRIKIFRRDDPIHISIHLEKHPHKEQYFCRAHIYLPARVLIAAEKSDSVSTAINKTFAAFSKQLDKLKYQVEASLKRAKSSIRKSGSLSEEEEASEEP